MRARWQNPPSYRAPGPGEEAEAAVVTEWHFGDELVASAAQPSVARRHRRGATQHAPLDNRFLTGRIGGDGHAARRRAAAVLTHLPSPSSIGTPTSDPYSVQEPS